MGTRADFYVGRDDQGMEWIGSIAWDGYPDGITPNDPGKVPMYPGGPLTNKRARWPDGEHLFDAATEEEFRERVTRFFEHRDDVTLPAHGWPWPWETSGTTDYAYAFDKGDGAVYGSCFGYPWFKPADGVPEGGDDGNLPAPYGSPKYPDMSTAKSARAGSKRSGVMVVSVPARNSENGA